MASNYIKINSDVLKRDASELKTLAQRSKLQLKDMKNEVNILGTMWSGPANDAFNKQFASDYEMFVELCVQVEKFSAELEKASNEYNSCENNVLNIVRSIRV